MSFARLTYLFVALALIAAPTWADRSETLRARNGLTVAGLGSQIEVFAPANFKGADVFCAAADFANRRRDAGSTDRLIIASALAPSTTRPGQRSVIFDLTPPQSQPLIGINSVFLRPRREGASLTVGHARFLCNETSRSRKSLDN